METTHVARPFELFADIRRPVTATNSYDQLMSDKELNAVCARCIITEKLCVKEMGPADQIRTKPEVKLFMESGNARAAEDLL